MVGKTDAMSVTSMNYFCKLSFWWCRGCTAKYTVILLATYHTNRSKICYKHKTAHDSYLLKPWAMLWHSLPPTTDDQETEGGLWHFCTMRWWKSINPNLEPGLTDTIWRRLSPPGFNSFWNENPNLGIPELLTLKPKNNRGAGEKHSFKHNLSVRNVFHSMHNGRYLENSFGIL